MEKKRLEKEDDVMIVHIEDNSPDDKSAYGIEGFSGLMADVRKSFVSATCGMQAGECGIHASKKKLYARYGDRLYVIAEIDSFLDYDIEIRGGRVSIAGTDMDALIGRFLDKLAARAAAGRLRRTGIVACGVAMNVTRIMNAAVFRLIHDLTELNHPFITGMEVIPPFREYIYVNSPDCPMYANKDVEISVNKAGDGRAYISGGKKEDLYNFLLSDECPKAVGIYKCALEKYGISLMERGGKLSNKLVCFQKHVIKRIPTVYEFYAQCGGCAGIPDAVDRWIESFGWESWMNDAFPDHVKEMFLGNDLCRSIYEFISVNAMKLRNVTEFAVVTEMRSPLLNNDRHFTHVRDRGLYADMPPITVMACMEEMEKNGILVSEMVDINGCTETVYRSCSGTGWMMETSHSSIPEILKKETINDDDAYMLLDCILQGNDMHESILDKFTQSVQCSGFSRKHRNEIIRILSESSSCLPEANGDMFKQELVSEICRQRRNAAVSVPLNREQWEYVLEKLDEVKNGGDADGRLETVIGAISDAVCGRPTS